MRLLFVCVATLGCLVASTRAQAAIEITPAGPHLAATSDATNNLNAAAVAALVGVDALTELYKSNVEDDGEEGAFTSSYETTYSNTESDPSDALIEYVTGEFINDPANIYSNVFLLVKDGNQTPNQYIFDLGAFPWDGLEDIELTGFFPDQGSISHIAIYGGNNEDELPPPSLPEPTTLAIWGLGLGIAGLVKLRRKKLAA